MKIVQGQISEDRQEPLRLIECPNCQEPMSYRVVENLYTYFNYDKEKKLFYKHVDGTYEKRYYECLDCGDTYDAFTVEREQL